MRDLIQIRDQLEEGQYNIQADFQLTAEDRERAYFEKIQREGAKWSLGTKDLKPLEAGQDVIMQAMRGTEKGKWTNTGKILVADPQNSQYHVKMDGSNRLALRNRVNLRPIEIQRAECFKMNWNETPDVRPRPRGEDNYEVSQPAVSDKTQPDGCLLYTSDAADE